MQGFQSPIDYPKPTEDADLGISVAIVDHVIQKGLDVIKIGVFES